MPVITAADIQTLRRQTGVGVLEAKKALHESDGDQVKALENLRKAGKKLAASKISRTVKEGAIGAYVHANHKVAAMVAVACETDFVARTDDFKSLAHDLALHVAAANPLYLQREDVPEAIVKKEREIYRQQLKTEDKPAKMIDGIVAGKLKKFYAEVCLLEQPFVKDETMNIRDVVQAAIAKLGENIQVISFSRLAV